MRCTLEKLFDQKILLQNVSINEKGYKMFLTKFYTIIFDVLLINNVAQIEFYYFLNSVFNQTILLN